MQRLQNPARLSYKKHGLYGCCRTESRSCLTMLYMASNSVTCSSSTLSILVLRSLVELSSFLRMRSSVLVSSAAVRLPKARIRAAVVLLSCSCTITDNCSMILNHWRKHSWHTVQLGGVPAKQEVQHKGSLAYDWRVSTACRLVDC